MNRSAQAGQVPGVPEPRIRSLAFGIFLVALGVVLGAGAREGGTRAPRPQQADRRQAIVLTPAQRDVLLAEMRGLLAAMQGILTAAVELNVAKMRQAAQGAGFAATLARRDSALEARLPEPFRIQRAEVHSAFDALADALRGFTARDTALSHLARIAQRCVACHAEYRFATTP